MRPDLYFSYQISRQPEAPCVRPNAQGGHVLLRPGDILQRSRSAQDCRAQRRTSPALGRPAGHARPVGARNRPTWTFPLAKSRRPPGLSSPAEAVPLAAGENERTPMQSNSTYDYIVVGAGSAGAVVASRLTESGAHRVLLLEAGTRGSNFFWSKVPVGVSKMIDDPAVNWCYASEPDEGSGGRAIAVPRGGRLQLDQRHGPCPRPGAGPRPPGAVGDMPIARAFDAFGHCSAMSCRSSGEPLARPPTPTW